MTDAPIFSIVIPTYNRPAQLTACLKACAELDYPQNRFEIIVVDDGSSVSVKVPKNDEFNLVNIICLRQLNSGPASARNFGAQHARGDILAFTDDDCMPDPQWLRELAQSFNDGRIGLVGGRIMNGLANNLYSTASQMIIDEAYGFFYSRNSELRFFSSNNMAVSTKLFQENGGFDSSFRTSEDRDFCDRWICAGHPFVYAPKAIVHHYHYLTMTGFCRQHFNYGRGAYQFHRVRAQRSGSRLKPDLQFYILVFRRMLFAPLSRKSFSMAGLMGLWQLANLVGFLWQAALSHHLSTNNIAIERFGQAKSASREIQSRIKRQD